MILDENPRIQNLPDGWFYWFYNRFLMILAFGWRYHVFMKNMKMLILQYLFKDFGWKSTHVDFVQMARFVEITNRFLMILAFGWCYHIFMKDMKMFILQPLMILDEKQAARKESTVPPRMRHGGQEESI